MAVPVAPIMAGVNLVGGLLDDSDEKALTELKKNQKLFEGIDVPDLFKYQYNPELYSSSGAYSPEEVEATEVSEDPMIRSAQLSALNKLSGLADTGLSEVDALGFENAKQTGAKAARSGRDAAIQDARARGVAGGGLEFALREIANQEGAGRARQGAMEQAASSAQMRALYNQAYGDQLSNVRGQDYQVNAGNADILNQFNMANTQNRNQGQLYNLQNNQNISNANVDQRNAGRQQKMDIAQQNYTNQLKRAEGLSGANKDTAKGYYAQNAGNNSTLGAFTSVGANVLDGAFNKKAKSKQADPNAPRLKKEI